MFLKTNSDTDIVKPLPDKGFNLIANFLIKKSQKCAD